MFPFPVANRTRELFLQHAAQTAKIIEKDSSAAGSSGGNTESEPDDASEEIQKDSVLETEVLSSVDQKTKPIPQPEQIDEVGGDKSISETEASQEQSQPSEDTKDQVAAEDTDEELPGI